MANEMFLGMPSLKTIATAVGCAIAFLVLAYVLYRCNGGSSSAYLLKVGDSFINGAVVGLLFAILKAMFDLPRYRQQQAAQQPREETAQRK